MEFAMHQAATADEDLPHADNAQIRLLIVKKKAAEYQQDDVETEGWAASSPETARDFSAVAWYFAREIQHAMTLLLAGRCAFCAQIYRSQFL